MTATHALKSARRSIAALNPAQALLDLESFQAEIRERPLSSVELSQARTEIEEICHLASGVSAGILSALSLIKELRSLSRGCDVYGKDGKRLSCGSVAGEARKF